MTVKIPWSHFWGIPSLGQAWRLVIGQSTRGYDKVRPIQGKTSRLWLQSRPEFEIVNKYQSAYRVYLWFCRVNLSWVETFVVGAELTTFTTALDDGMCAYILQPAQSLVLWKSRVGLVSWRLNEDSSSSRKAGGSRLQVLGSLLVRLRWPVGDTHEIYRS